MDKHIVVVVVLVDGGWIGETLVAVRGDGMNRMGFLFEKKNTKSRVVGWMGSLVITIYNNTIAPLEGWLSYPHGHGRCATVPLVFTNV